MNRYVKKPIAIEAVKWKGFNNDEIKDFAGDSVKIELSWMVVDLSTIHHSALSIIRIPVVLIHGCRLSATYSPMTGKKYDM